MRRVTYTSPFVPAELIAAYGFAPCRIAVRRDGGEHAPADAEGLCPYAGAFARQVCAVPPAPVVLATTCDQMRRCADLIESRSRAPLFVLNVPHTWQTPAAAGLYRSELRRLGRFLVRAGGRAPTDGELVEAILRHDAARAELRAARDRLSARGWAEAAAEFHREGVFRRGDPRPPARRTGVAVAVLGCPSTPEDYWILDAIEVGGAWVTLDATDTGERTLPAPLDPDSVRRDPLAALVDAYWRSIPDVFQRPNTRLRAWLAREMRSRGARGLIVRHPAWCDLWRAEAAALAECANVPVLRIDVEEGGPCRERTLTRLQAFLETLP